MRKIQKPSTILWVVLAIGIAIVTPVIINKVTKPHEVTIELLRQERLDFESRTPRSAGHLTKENFASRIAENVEFGRLYSSESFWNSKSVLIEGYWGGHIDGMSIHTNKDDSRSHALLMKPSSQLRRWKLPFYSKFVPNTWITEPYFLEVGERIRIEATYHATGYSPGSFSESASWLEFKKIERWDEDKMRWRVIRIL